MIRSGLSRREKYIFILTVVIVILAGVYNFILGPSFKKWHSLNSEIAIEKARVKKGLKLLETQNAIIDEYNSYVSSLGNISKILSYVERQSEALGIKTSNIRPRPVVQKGLYKEYIIELQIEGEFSDINKFVPLLIKSPIFISVKKFDFRNTGKTSSYLKGTLILSKLII